MRYLHWLSLNLYVAIVTWFRTPLRILRNVLATLIMPFSENLSLLIRMDGLMCSRRLLVSQLSCNYVMAHLINAIDTYFHLDIRLHGKGWDNSGYPYLDMVRENMLNDYSLFKRWWPILHGNDPIPVLVCFLERKEITEKEYHKLLSRNHQVYTDVTVRLLQAQTAGAIKSAKFDPYTALDMSQLN